MKKAILIIMLLMVTFVSAYDNTNTRIYLSFEEYNQLDNSTIIIGSEPVYSGNYNLDQEGNYILNYVMWQVSLFDNQTLAVNLVSNPIIVYRNQLNWCYGLYPQSTCNQFFLTYTQPINLCTYGYNQSNCILYPIEYLKNELWIENYLNNIEYLGISFVDEYGNLFGEGETPQW